MCEAMSCAASSRCGVTMPVNIRGKSYTLIAERVAIWNERYPNSKISTEVEHLACGACVAKATGVPDVDNPAREFTGPACERSDESQMHERNHIEIAETSAVGRMLVFAGISSDGSIASADDVTREMSHQKSFDAAATSHNRTTTASRVPDALQSARARLDGFESVGQLVGAADKICACVEVGPYSRAQAQELLRRLFANANKRAATQADGRAVVVYLQKNETPVTAVIEPEEYQQTQRRALETWERLQQLASPNDEQGTLPPM